MAQEVLKRKTVTETRNGDTTRIGGGAKYTIVLDEEEGTAIVRDGRQNELARLEGGISVTQRSYRRTVLHGEVDGVPVTWTLKCGCGG